MTDLGSLKALAFDYFGTIGNKHGLGAIIDEHVPGGHGAAIAKLWFQTCQRYCFQNGMMGRYAPWNELTASALNFATAELSIVISDDVRDHLLAADRQVPVYEEASVALERLSKSFQVYVLSMGAASMIENSQDRANIKQYFTGNITTEPDRVYKPSGAAYQIGVREIGFSTEEIGFVSGNSFDVIGAKNFGFPTIWVRRYGQPLDELGLEPDLVVGDLTELADALAP